MFAQPLIVAVTANQAGAPYNEPVQGGLVIFTGPSAGPGLAFSPLTATVDANGQAKTSNNLFANTSLGSYSVTASTLGMTSASVAFTLTNRLGTAHQMTLTLATANPVAGTPTDLTVRVFDDHNNPVIDYTGTVHFTSRDPLARSGNGLPNDYTFTTTGLNPDNGVHLFPGGVTFKTSGDERIVVDGVTAGGQQDWLVTPGPARSVKAAGGTPQSARVGQSFMNPLAVTVTDAFNNRVGAGTTVTYTMPGNGAAGAFAGGVTTATTDESGGATPPVFTANMTAGSFILTAGVPNGDDPPATFSLTNTPVLTAVAVPAGSVSGGARVTLTGAGFAAGATVAFDGIAATNVTVINSTTITATTPAHAAGLVDVAVRTVEMTVTLPQAYTYGVVAPLPLAPRPGTAGGSPSPLPGPLPTPRS
jgi:IPT/TIG domain